MRNLVEFLESQLDAEYWLANDEDQRTRPTPRPGGKGFYPPPIPSPFRYTFNPARAHADCTMRRTLLRVADEHEDVRGEILRALGEVYRSHPDFDSSWLRRGEPVHKVVDKGVVCGADNPPDR
ncbi:hypothetical protein H1Q78_19240 [Cellulosimicrobium cellulans]|uniref:DUF6221 family protein n=1 Tax=Cellulosimicrobium cellulans TaxID=1710 RepID=UPI001EDA083C|nr:DUF6221 family protein [Cellulosimicrobium cellulans]UKJ63707.1 hypothetical protein H1Q78_19240 [Cellulosimicrobium cellulans]